MASVKNDDDRFEVVEWRVKNFSYWSKEIHGISIDQYYTGLRLFPRGLNGDGEYVVVDVYDRAKAFSVGVSFLGSDGSLLFKQQIYDPKWKDNIEVLPPGPKFEEIVQARKKNHEIEDIFTIICRLDKDKGVNELYYAQTNLMTSDFVVRVSNRLFNEMECGQSTEVSSMGYYQGEDGWKTENESLELLASSAESTTTEGDAKVLFTLITGSAHEKVSVHTCLSLRDKDDTVIKHLDNDHIYRDKHDWIFYDSLRKNEVVEEGYSFIIRIKVFTKLIQHEQKISLYNKKCAEIVTLPLESSKKLAVAQSSNSMTFLLKELMGLYQDQDFADFQIHCENVTFPVHRGILSARSPVFKSMMSSNMKEALSGSMEITDLDVNTLGRFLLFLYSGTVEDLVWDSALTLYYAADKYQVFSLKDECKAVLGSSVSNNNVCKILSLGNKHQDDDLVSATLEFLLEKDEEVFKSEEWEGFMLSEPYLAAKTVTEVLMSKLHQKE